MIILSPEHIQVDEAQLSRIDDTIRSIYRLIVFNKQHQNSDLLGRYLEAVEHLRDVLSIKNAQQEAQSIEEAKAYLETLKEGLALIVDEIADQRTMATPIDLFRLIRTIAPEAAAANPNRYRQTTVLFGPCSGAEPRDIPTLIEEVFYHLPTIRHPVLRAIYLHHELVRIHPFVDGNGRLSRLAKNWLLMFDLYPPMFISNFSDKKNYIDKLQASFLALEAKPNQPHPETKEFFGGELKRMQASAGFILNRMINHPTMTFEEMQERDKEA